MVERGLAIAERDLPQQVEGGMTLDEKDQTQEERDLTNQGPDQSGN